MTGNPRTAPKRTELLRVRLSRDERRIIRSRAEDCGRPESSFVRELALGSVPRARPRRIEQEAVRAVGRIGGNLNQLARIANTTGRIEQSGRLNEAIEELLRAVRKLL